MANGDEPFASLILPTAASKGSLCQAYKGGGMERALKKCDITEDVKKPGGGRIAFEAATSKGQKNKLKI